MQVHSLQGLGDDSSLLSSVISSVGTAATPEIEAIVVPIIAPYAIALVILSAAGLLFGLSAYSKVNRLRHELVKKSKSTTSAATP
jgi:hypothetical protein